MNTQKTTVPFKGTKEQEEQLMNVIAAYKGEKGALMSVLQQAQKIYGYLPIEVQQIISREMQVPMTKIFGVVTFFSLSLQPKGKYKISICMGTTCYVKGARQIYVKLQQLLGIIDGECTPDGKFSLEICRCTGTCSLSPVIKINDTIHGNLTPDSLEDILAKYE